MYLKTKTEHVGFLARSARAVKSKVARWICERIPVGFGVEPTNLCNANCTFCGYRFQSRGRGVMGMGVFQRAVDEYCLLGGGDLNLTPTVGEPLLDETLADKIGYARDKKEVKRIWFYSNLIDMSRVDLNDLLTSGLSELRISTCIKDEETYRKIYRSSHYQRMLDNIVKLVEVNQSLGQPVHLMLFLRLPKPFSESQKAKDFQRIVQYFPRKDVIVLDDAYDSWGGRVKEEDLPQGNLIYDNTLDQSKEPCSELYRRMNILYDGSVNNCVCRDLDAALKIGDVNKSSLAEIWRGKELGGLRSRWSQGVVPDTCRGCQRYLPAGDYLSANFGFIFKRYLRYLWSCVHRRLNKSDETGGVS